MSMNETLTCAERAMQAQDYPRLGGQRLGEMPWDRTIRELKEENARLQSAMAKHFAAIEEPDTGRNPAPPNPVRERIDGVIKDLVDRSPLKPDRQRLRDALDKADKPLGGRAGADEALGKAIRCAPGET